MNPQQSSQMGSGMGANRMHAMAAGTGMQTAGGNMGQQGLMGQQHQPMMNQQV